VLCRRNVGEEGYELSTVEVLRIGERARVALARSGGVAAPLAGFADAPYLEAGREIIWVGARLPALHPRAVMVSYAPPRGLTLRFAALPERGWSPQLPVLGEDAAARAVDAACTLRRALLGECAPRGFGMLLAGRAPGFPLDLALPRVRALAEAYRRDDPDAVLASSAALLGFGTGLTPAGDDLAGAALFGRRFFSPRDRRWQAVAERLSREVVLRSHAVSAALFDDLAQGQSFAPLHELSEALARAEHDAALAAARTLSAIGHSSGWDMLAGLMIGLAVDLSATVRPAARTPAGR
jgi:hypothetical protein